MSQHYLNGQQVQEPRGWSDFEMVLERDPKDRIIGVKAPLTVTFVEGSYRTLRDIFEQDVCEIIPYEVRESCGSVSLPVLRGSIVLADVDWNLSKCQAECTIVDDSIYARIRNNWRVPISPQSPESMNGVAITPVTFRDIEVFDPSDPVGDYLTPTRAMYDWYQCFEHAVAYVSDGLIPIVSDWYAALPDNERWAVVRGFQLRTGNTNPERQQVVYTFTELWSEMAKMYNLYMCVVRDANGNPVVRIEPDEYWFGPDVLRDYPSQPDLVQSIDRNQLYSRVDIGSEDAQSNRSGINGSLPYTPLGTFFLEEYSFEGACNQDEILDLMAEWLRCSNRIELAVVSGSQEHDDTIFLVQYTATTDQATKTDYFTEGGPWLYNVAGLNVNVLNRHNLPGNVGIPLAADTAAFLAERTASVANPSWTNLVPTGGTQVPIFILGNTFQFDDDYTFPFFDAGDNYGGTTVQGNPVPALQSVYDAPVAGWYVFRASINWEVLSGEFSSPECNPRPRVRLTFIRYNAANTQLSFAHFFSDPSTVQGAGIQNFTIAHGFGLQPTDRVRVFASFDDLGRQQPCALPYGVTVAMRPGSTLGTIFTPIAGGAVTSIDPGAARIVTLNFERHMTATDWVDILSDPRPAFRVAPDATSFRTGHFAKISRRTDGRTTFDLISPRNTI